MFQSMHFITVRLKLLGKDIGVVFQSVTVICALLLHLFCDKRCLLLSLDYTVGHVPWGGHDGSDNFVLEALEYSKVGVTGHSFQLHAISSDRF